MKTVFGIKVKDISDLIINDIFSTIIDNLDLKMVYFDCAFKDGKIKSGKIKNFQTIINLKFNEFKIWIFMNLLKVIIII
jgi:hypothetical protein